MFSKVKQMSQNTQSTKRTISEVSTEAPQAKKPKAQTGPHMPYEFDENDGDNVTIVMDKSHDGELLPQGKIKGEETSKYAAQWNTPCLTLKFGDTKVGGDTGKFGKDETNYKYNLKTVVGLSDKVAKYLPNEEDRQVAFEKWRNDVAVKLLTKAFETKGCMEKETKKATKLATKNGTTGLSEFIKAANLSFEKTCEDPDGDEHAMFCAARRGQYKNENGELVDNRMVFWRRTVDGYVKADVKYVASGSVVKYQVSFRIYKMPGNYGVSCDLGKNVILVKEESSSNFKSGAPELPYMDF
jgi:hypothetical protein